MIPGTNIHSAERLREEFDASFAAPLRTAGSGEQEFVLVAVGPWLAALPVTAICGIERGVEVVPAPSRLPALMGLAGVRGTVVPVFSLPLLLGVTPAAEAWQRQPLFALVDDGRGGRIGLGFARLLRFVRAGADQLPHAQPPAASILTHEDESFQLVDPAALLGNILRGEANLASHAHKTEPPHRRETDTR